MVKTELALPALLSGGDEDEGCCCSGVLVVPGAAASTVEVVDILGSAVVEMFELVSAS